MPDALPRPLLLLLLAVAVAAAPQVARAQAPAVAAPAPAAAPRAAARITDADIRFMQGMIGHHAQALVMSGLVASRTTNPTVGLLAERIDVAQQQEIARMQRWLAAHNHAAMGDHAMLMPGMLTAAQLEQLSAARGAAFDRLFLALMIQHHEGALAMVATLFSTPGSGQEPALFEFASDVDGGQRAEIARMRALLKAPARGARR